MDKRKPRRGRPPRHGGYSITVARGELPEGYAHVRAYLTEVRERLLAERGGEDKAPAAVLVLIDRVVSKLGVLRMIEEYTRQHGIMKGADLSSVLRKSYLGWANSLRLDLVALGINPASLDRGPDAATLISGGKAKP